MRLFEGCDDRRPLVMDDGIGLAEALLGLPGFRVLAVTEPPGEVVIEIEKHSDGTLLVLPARAS